MGRVTKHLATRQDPYYSTDIRNTREIDAVWIGGRKLANAP